MLKSPPPTSASSYILKSYILSPAKCGYWQKKATRKGWRAGVAVRLRCTQDTQGSQTHTRPWINISFSPLTGSDWSRTHVRSRDENSRCLLWRRMSSNRALSLLMKPTGRQRQRKRSLRSPTHLSWLERLNSRDQCFECSRSYGWSAGRPPTVGICSSRVKLFFFFFFKLSSNVVFFPWFLK